VDNKPAGAEHGADMPRRSFICGMAALPAMGAAQAAPQEKPQSGSRFAAIQVAPNTLLDEGIERCLDLLQECAAINVIVVQSHTYYASDGLHSKRSPDCLAPDHGIPVRDPAKRKLPLVWVKHHEEYFRNTVLRHVATTRDMEYADHDLFRELVEPCRKRNIRIYPRMLDPFRSEFAEIIPNWVKVLGVDIYGRLGPATCYHNPDYRMWWLGTVDDVFRNYELDGLQWGAECVGPLSNLMFNGTVPYCFCEHCRARGKQEGIDVERARRGFEELYVFVQKLRQGERPPGGAMAGIMNHCFRFPEILAWERLWRRGKEELMEQIYGAVKAVNPRAEVGQHVDHAGSTYDIFYRSVVSYAEMTNVDFIKPILYHDILGPRMRHWYVERLQKSIFSELSPEQSLDLFYAFKGYDKNVEPKLDDLDKTGLSPEYIYRETKSLVDSVQGRTKIYSGIGLDVPWNGHHYSSDPEKVYRAVHRAYDAGANGVMLSRQYDEMRLPNLRAAGKAIRERAPG
jgi:hypothetical protein